MRVTLRQFAVFEAIVRLGSGSLAAQEVAMSQSAASLALKALETALGVELFHRARKKLTVNDNGRRLLPYVKSLLTIARDIESHGNTDESTTRTLSICTSSTIGAYLIPKLVARFQKNYPNVQIRLIIASESEVIDQVEQLRADLGFVESLSMRPSLIVQPWLQDRLQVVASPRHWAAARRIAMPQLEGEKWCLQPLNSANRHAFTQLHGETVRTGAIVLESESIEGIKGAIKAGAGIGCLPHLAVRADIDRGELVALKIRDFSVVRQFNILVRREVYKGDLATAFMAEALKDLTRRARPKAA